MRTSTATLTKQSPVKQPIYREGDSSYLEIVRRHTLGQFLTPNPVADLIASFFFNFHRTQIELLDAGAGAGALTAALVRRLCREQFKPKRISVTAYELDSNLIKPLRATLLECQRICECAGIAFSANVLNEDFIAASVPVVRRDIFSSQTHNFNMAIVNPPYRKISSDSLERSLLESAGIETSNLYTGFVAIISKLLAKGGELAAITPRSFCNGPYFKAFRVNFLETMSLRRIHGFESRSAAFRDDDVLQENVIFHAVKTRSKPEHVIVSSSSGEPDSPITKHKVAYREVVDPEDSDKFIHLIVDDVHTRVKLAMRHLHGTLNDLGINVSTGRVVDFRVRSFLRQYPGTDTVPLIYPCHFNGGSVSWPKDSSHKPNAIVKNEQTFELLLPAGVYVLVKRFSAKEERRRIVASIYNPHRIGACHVGFENHLNVFHSKGHGLSMTLAKGLAAFLNSTIVDLCFREFSGHTQINATDLRHLNYPSRAALERLGRRIDDSGTHQHELDSLVEDEFFSS
ncbi:MAG: Eco57I restriction-modification methylase domain-containing protein [Elusimicrobia bacterium]|nr:Eco57I restriction-modification methylase domain-containing protein [Elusimicrobiota bacterium]